ncbi:MAG: hypothetical protein AAGF78_15185 [Pseudomonadota bacterium]
MRFMTVCAVGAACLGAQVSAEGLAHLSFSSQVLTGETFRDIDALTGSFTGASRFAAIGVYETGATSLYGSLVFDNVDFTGRGLRDNTREASTLELGLDYAAGQFTIGANASVLDLANLDEENTLTSLALYGDYGWDGFHAGAALVSIEASDGDFDDVGFALFGGYETPTGLALGAQVTEIDDETFYTAYATYATDAYEITLDVTGDDNDRLARLFGAYYVLPEVAVIGGFVDLDTGFDGTTERYVGARVDVAPGYSAEFALYDLEAFNGFEGDGVSFKIGYEVGSPRRGYQSFATIADRLLSPIFYSF